VLEALLLGLCAVVALWLTILLGSWSLLVGLGVVTWAELIPCLRYNLQRLTRKRPSPEL
jgi:hypothetical protein